VFRLTGRDIGGIKHGGAAGGVAAGLAGILNAKLVSGIDYFLDSTGFDVALQTAGLVITGEGCLDTQTLEGKAPYGVAVRAKAKGVPVVGLAGRVTEESTPALREWFEVLLPIGAGPEDLTEALRHTEKNLRRTARELGNILALAVAGRDPRDVEEQ